MIHEIKFQDYIEINDFSEITNKIDPDLVASRRNISIYRQLIDIAGEVEHAISSYEGGGKREDIVKYLYTIHEYCCIIYENKEELEGTKRELKSEEWMLWDFLLGDNSMDNDVESVCSWFRSWIYDINYEIVYG